MPENKDAEKKWEESDKMIGECLESMKLSNEVELLAVFKAVHRHSHEDEKVVEFLKLLKERGILHSVLSWIVKYDVERNKNGILREESFGASLLKNYWFHFEGKNYLKQLLRPLIKEVTSLTKTKALEIDPKRAPASEIDQSLKTILSLSTNFLEKFWKSYSLFPRSVSFFSFFGVVDVEKRIQRNIARHLRTLDRGNSPTNRCRNPKTVYF